jgi:ribosome biogenesis GTPase
MTRQEKRGLADLRAMKRHQRVNEILAHRAKSSQSKTNPSATKRAADAEIQVADSLVIGIGPGVCIIAGNGGEEICQTEMNVVPGDRVAIRHGKVAAIGKRRTTLSRTDPANPHRERLIAANIDVLAIVASIVDPPFRPGLVDRYLIAAARGGVQAVLCVTKTDLNSETYAADSYRESGVPVVLCSAANGAGIDELCDLLAGNLTVFAGHSGVGKSSLLNALAKNETARTGRVSEGSGRGRHTTTSSRLYELKNGARIIDTPGIREFGLGTVTVAELRAAFQDFSEFPCRFRDCRHRNEPDCGVRAAVEAGKIHRPRYVSYLRIADDRN